MFEFKVIDLISKCTNQLASRYLVASNMWRVFYAAKGYNLSIIVKRNTCMPKIQV